MKGYSVAPDFAPARLFRRCLQCPGTAPSCPVCKSDESCVTTIGDCNSCASAHCVKTTLSGSTNTNANSNAKSDSNVAGIAGGVVGGIAGIAIIVFLIWKFWLKGRRREITQEELASYEDDLPIEKSTPKSLQLRDARSSTHTVNSLASTVLTRASNVIQIAYIPGVTNVGQDHLIPPVPPIPIPTSPSSGGTYEGEQHFFVPHLRNSAYSDTSSVMTGMTGDHRKSVASSLARSSIGTMIYQDNAIANPMPTTIARGAAKVVSVKSSNSPNGTPAVTPGEFTRTGSSGSGASRPVIVKMLGSSDSLKPITTAKSMKPISLNIINGKKAASIGDDVASPTSSGAASPATPRSGARFPSSRPFTAISLTESVDTTRSSVMPHARARASVARSHRTLGEESDGEDLDEDFTHARSRKSLLSKERSPFGDEAAVASSERLVGTPTSTRPGGRSPFEDANAV